LTSNFGVALHEGPEKSVLSQVGSVSCEEQHQIAWPR
jgi:hypothetical protein